MPDDGVSKAGAAKRTPAKRTRRSKAVAVPDPEPTDAELDAQLADATPDAFEAAYEAHRLRLKGLPWREVARATGYGSAKSAVDAVSDYLQAAAAAMSPQQAQEALQTEVDRYEAVLAAWWDQGTTGKDEKAASIVLRTLERLDRVLRLTEGEAVVTKETVVIASDPEAYVRMLQDVVAERGGR